MSMTPGTCAVNQSRIHTFVCHHKAAVAGTMATPTHRHSSSMPRTQVATNTGVYTSIDMTLVKASTISCMADLSIYSTTTFLGSNTKQCQHCFAISQLYAFDSCGSYAMQRHSDARLHYKARLPRWPAPTGSAALRDKAPSQAQEQTRGQRSAQRPHA